MIGVHMVNRLGSMRVEEFRAVAFRQKLVGGRQLAIPEVLQVVHREFFKGRQWFQQRQELNADSVVRRSAIAVVQGPHIWTKAKHTQRRATPTTSKIFRRPNEPTRPTSGAISRRRGCERRNRSEPWTSMRGVRRMRSGEDILPRWSRAKCVATVAEADAVRPRQKEAIKDAITVGRPSIWLVKGRGVMIELLDNCFGRLFDKDGCDQGDDMRLATTPETINNQKGKDAPRNEKYTSRTRCRKKTRQIKLCKTTQGTRNEIFAPKIKKQDGRDPSLMQPPTHRAGQTTAAPASSISCRGKCSSKGCIANTVGDPRRRRRTRWEQSSSVR